MARATGLTAFNEIFYRLHLGLRHENGRWVVIWRITVTAFPLCLVALLGKTRIYTDNNISAGME
jgi:hypothetical protein